MMVFRCDDCKRPLLSTDRYAVYGGRLIRCIDCAPIRDVRASERLASLSEETSAD